MAPGVASRLVAADLPVMGHRDFLLVLLQFYFMLMNMTVERTYCHDRGELVKGDSRFLMRETFDFCLANNRLFLARPEWMRIATCFSAYAFFPFYGLIAYAAATQAWNRLKIPILIFIGAKLNALVFYHTMEFLSDTPPQNLVPYFSV